MARRLVVAGVIRAGRLQMRVLPLEAPDRPGVAEAEMSPTRTAEERR